jgi:hypothetical protein
MGPIVMPRMPPVPVLCHAVALGPSRSALPVSGVRVTRCEGGERTAPRTSRRRSCPDPRSQGSEGRVGDRVEIVDDEIRAHPF